MTAPAHTGLREAMAKGQQKIVDAYTEILEGGQAQGLIPAEADVRQAAWMIAAVFWAEDLSSLVGMPGFVLEGRKSDTREMARHCKLKTADKEESMEICFVPDNNYGDFLQQANLVQKHRGEIVNLHGQVLGHHDGIEFYTIGQRNGLGLSAPQPLYVIELDADNNRVVVGNDSALDRDEFIVDRCNWIPFQNPPALIEVMAKIRYNHPGTPATVTPLGQGTARVKLHTSQRAITPGQAAVFYQDDLVVGGGWIMR